MIKLHDIESIERSIAIKNNHLKSTKESGSLSLIRDTYLYIFYFIFIV